MKALSLSLLIFAMVILLTSALPDIEKDRPRRLAESASLVDHGTSLPKGKPSLKIPGPEKSFEAGPDFFSESSKMEPLNGKGGKMKRHLHQASDDGKETYDRARFDGLNRGKSKKHLARGGKYKEETEEESSPF